MANFHYNFLITTIAQIRVDQLYFLSSDVHNHWIVGKTAFSIEFRINFHRKPFDKWDISFLVQRGC
jgi:hypothetical protein